MKQSSFSVLFEMYILSLIRIYSVIHKKKRPELRPLFVGHNAASVQVFNLKFNLSHVEHCLVWIKARYKYILYILWGLLMYSIYLMLPFSQVTAIDDPSNKFFIWKSNEIIVMKFSKILVLKVNLSKEKKKNLSRLTTNQSRLTKP